MILKDFLRQVASRSANVDNQTLLDLTNSAAQELWDSSDFPGSLEEGNFKPYDLDQAFVSLPYYVDSIRGVKPCQLETTEVYSKSAGFHPDFYLYSPWMWREIGRTALKRDLEEASQLTIKRVHPKSQQSVLVYLSGQTDVAASESEIVAFDPGDITKQTEKAYEHVMLLGKDISTDSDFQVLDSAGNEVGFIPNNYLEVNHLVIQIQERCSCACACGCTCVQILYKRKLAPFTGDLDLIPPGIENALLMKVQEWIDLRGTDTLERASLMAQKSDSLWNRVAYNKEKSLIKPLQKTRTPFVRFKGSDL